MKIVVKTLKGIRFAIEVKPDDSVAELKKKIEAVEGGSAYPAAQQMLIHKGKLLKDETTMVENNVAEKSVIAIMMTKSKPVSTEAPTASAGLKAQAWPPSINRGFMDPAERFRRVAMFSPLPPGVPASAAANRVHRSNSESWPKQIIEKGGGNFDRHTVVRTHHGGGNSDRHLERAVEHLYPGIPEQTADPPLVLTQEPAASEKCDPHAFYYVPEELLNSGTLDFLRYTEQYKTLQPMVQGRPCRIKSILEELGKQNPPLLRLIKENKAQFLALIKEEPLEGGESGNRLALPEEEIEYQHAEILRFLNDEPIEGGDEEQSEIEMEIKVTAEEYEAIERLEAMGFERGLVTVVFFACKTNEELAAKYLLDHFNDFNKRLTLNQTLS